MVPTSKEREREGKGREGKGRGGGSERTGRERRRGVRPPTAPKSGPRIKIQNIELPGEEHRQ